MQLNNKSGSLYGDFLKNSELVSMPIELEQLAIEVPYMSTVAIGDGSSIKTFQIHQGILEFNNNNKPFIISSLYFLEDTRALITYKIKSSGSKS